jgi:cytochrome oxidase assembly protein ShyY1
MSRRNQIVGKALFGSLTAFTFGLGGWQTYRYFEIPNKGGVDHHSLVSIPTSNFNLSHPVLLGPRKHESDAKQFGYYIFVPSVSDSLLVCIGWIKKRDWAEGQLDELKFTTPEMSIQLNVGAERGNYFSPHTPSADGTFLWAEKEAMLFTAGLPSTASIGETYDTVTNLLQPKAVREPYLTKWTHAGYALTWYSLTCAGLFMMKHMFKK